MWVVDIVIVGFIISTRIVAVSDGRRGEVVDLKIAVVIISSRTETWLCDILPCVVFYSKSIDVC